MNISRNSRGSLWSLCRVTSRKNTSTGRLWCHIGIKTASSVESAVASVREARCTALVRRRIHSWHHRRWSSANGRGTASSTWRRRTSTGGRSSSVWWNNSLFRRVNANWGWVVVQRWINWAPRAAGRGKKSAET